MTELLAPAGTLEKLKWAVAYGADAVYFGAKFGSLRSYAGNLTFDEIQEGIDYLHERDLKGYLTLNIYPFSDEYDRIEETARLADEIGVDAIIVADLGVLFQLKKMNLRSKLHVSTQANTVSFQAIKAYEELGARRINLARELSLEQVKEIQRGISGSTIETEVFIHGSVCFSYSGRCAISDYLAGRKANRGECAQSCRWEYYLMEEKRPGEYLPVFEDERGLYLFNSKDLALFPFIKELSDIGVNSFKIEGRMKTVHYLASVISLYRRIMNGENISVEEGMRLLQRVKNKGYSYGFMKGNVTPDDYLFENFEGKSDSVFVGNVSSQQGDSSVMVVRNSIFSGEILELLKPDGSISEYKLPSPLVTTDGEFLDKGNNIHTLVLPGKLPQFSLFRRVNETHDDPGFG